MAPSGGHIVVPLAMRLLRRLSQKASAAIREKLASLQLGKAPVQPVYARNPPRQPIHPAAYLRQAKPQRSFSTQAVVNATLRQFTSSSAARAAARPGRAAWSRSTIGAAVGRLTTRAPFASTLRPNLTGGALPRTAGGYSLGAGRVGSVRHFSHTPAAPAQVLNNVSASVRAFWLAGYRAQYDGTDRHTGLKRFKTITQLQDQAEQKLRSVARAAPGSYVDFHLTPTITAMSAAGGFVSGSSGAGMDATSAIPALHNDGLLDAVSADFSRAVRDLAMVLHDLNRLSLLGDLPVSTPDRSIIRVRFPGCDAQTVERLCDEVGVQRGIIHEDVDFDALVGADLALQYPFAPSGAESVYEEAEDDQHTVGDRTGERRWSPPDPVGPTVHRDEIHWSPMMSPRLSPRRSSPAFSPCSDTGYDHVTAGEAADADDAWLSGISGYCSLHASSADADNAGAAAAVLGYGRRGLAERAPSPSEYEGLEGIHRFLELCDGARR
ncbi:MAG: hypothetical protein M1826_001087 [Phylliscum demangeonii]|nr:MAG: hypothetical protein M1826_001087 [Phylliscum demangeonii]